MLSYIFASLEYGIPKETHFQYYLEIFQSAPYLIGNKGAINM